MNEFAAEISLTSHKNNRKNIPSTLSVQNKKYKLHLRFLCIHSLLNYAENEPRVD
jgi:hypothetical protein